LKKIAKIFKAKVLKICCTVLSIWAHRTCVQNFVRIGQKTVGGRGAGEGGI